jgi:excisionase family DNA binding protein
MTDPITVTITEARRLSGLSNTTVYKLIGEGSLAIVKVGTRTLVTFESLRRLLAPTHVPARTHVRTPAPDVNSGEGRRRTAKETNARNQH